MNSFGLKIILKIQLSLIALMLMSGTGFAQKCEKHLLSGADLNAVLFPCDRTFEESSFKSVYDKVSSYGFTETIDINFCIPKISKRFSGDLRNANQTAGMNSSDIKKEYMMSPNNMIPFTTDAKISYSVRTPGIVILKIYDSDKKEISTIVNEFQSSGDYEVHFSAVTNEFSIPASEIFYYSIEINNFAEIKSKI
jgi:hypothetical protein